MDKQLPYSFIGLIVPDRFWWTTIDTNSESIYRDRILEV
jgi:hypothetical protein